MTESTHKGIMARVSRLRKQVIPELPADRHMIVAAQGRGGSKGTGIQIECERMRQT